MHDTYRHATTYISKYVGHLVYLCCEIHAYCFDVLDLIEKIMMVV